MDRFGIAEKLEEIRKSVPEEYDLPGLDLMEIAQKSGSDRYDLIANGFYAGFYLGQLEAQKRGTQSGIPYQAGICRMVQRINDEKLLRRLWLMLATAQK